MQPSLAHLYGRADGVLVSTSTTKAFHEKILDDDEFFELLRMRFISVIIGTKVILSMSVEI